MALLNFLVASRTEVCYNITINTCVLGGFNNAKSFKKLYFEHAC